MFSWRWPGKSPPLFYVSWESIGESRVIGATDGTRWATAAAHRGRRTAEQDCWPACWECFGFRAVGRASDTPVLSVCRCVGRRVWAGRRGGFLRRGGGLSENGDGLSDDASVSSACRCVGRCVCGGLHRRRGLRARRSGFVQCRRRPLRPEVSGRSAVRLPASALLQPQPSANAAASMQCGLEAVACRRLGKLPAAFYAGFEPYRVERVSNPRLSI